MVLKLESFGQRPAILDLGSLLSMVIAQNQLPILGLQALQTTFKVIQAVLLSSGKSWKFGNLV